MKMNVLTQMDVQERVSVCVCVYVCVRSIKDFFHLASSD